MIIPFRGASGFSLTAEKREVAAYYGVDWRALTKFDGRHSEMINFARHALFWKLISERKLSPGRAAHLLGCTRKQVSNGARLHQKRIIEFRATSGLTERRKA